MVSAGGKEDEEQKKNTSRSQGVLQTQGRDGECVVERLGLFSMLNLCRIAVRMRRPSSDQPPQTRRDP